MVWKTNFDQIPYTEFLESRQQKSTSSSAPPSSNQATLQQQKPSLATSNGNGNANVNNNNNVIHARPNTAVNSLASSSQARDQSPITIPLNESLIYQNDDSNNSNEFLQSLDPTGAALVSATSAQKNINTNIHQNRPNSKKLSYVSNGSNGSNNSNGNLSNSSDKTGSTINSSTGSILKKLTNSSNENEINGSIPNNLTNTLEHIVQQLDILTQVTLCHVMIISTS